MNIKHYLKRINYTGDLSLNLEVLKNLQQSHLLYVPFENLDIQYGNTIDLDLDKIYSKVVEQGRGGFCYELNGLFNELLRELGFNSKMISARVYDSKNQKFGEEFDHLAIIVKLNNVEYLVDVGFGEFAFHPLKMELNKTQSDPRGDFIIEEHKNGYYQVSKMEGETKLVEYIFTKKKRDLMEFTEMCRYHQTSPKLHFTQKRLISKPTQNGRITISGNMLKVTDNGGIIKELTFDNQNFSELLLNWFGIEESVLIG